MFRTRVGDHSDFYSNGKFFLSIVYQESIINEQPYVNLKSALWWSVGRKDA